MTDLQRQAWIAAKQTEAMEWQVAAMRAVMIESEQHLHEARMVLNRIHGELLAFAEAS